VIADSITALYEALGTKIKNRQMDKIYEKQIFLRFIM